MKNEFVITKGTESYFLEVPDLPFHLSRINVESPFENKIYHYHDCYELYYLYSGERYYFITNKTYHISSGTFVLINPNEIHETGKIGDFGYDRIVIYFQKEFIDLVDNKNLFKIFNEGIKSIKLDNDTRFIGEYYLKKLEEAYIQKNITNVKLYLIQVLLLLNDKKSKNEEKQIENLTSIEQIIFEIVGYININYKENINLIEISKKYYISKYYLSRKFKEITRYGFVEYLNNVRIKEAIKLLKNTNYSIEKIAEECGYGNVTHFGRIFKSINNISPYQFKKKYMI